MKLSALLKDVAVAIANNAAIESYCQAMFGKSISVYVHIDAKSPPSVSKAPWAGITIQTYSRPAENNTHVVTFQMESAVYCSEPQAVPAAEETFGEVVILKGFETIEDLSDLVFAAIETAVSTSATQLSTTYNDEQQTSLTISEFPGWIASRVWTISTHV